MLENSDGNEFYVVGGVLETIHGETVLRMGKVWWFYHLVALMVRNRAHKRGSQIASDGEKKSCETRWWIETPSRKSTGRWTRGNYTCSFTNHLPIKSIWCQDCINWICSLIPYNLVVEGKWLLKEIFAKMEIC